MKYNTRAALDYALYIAKIAQAISPGAIILPPSTRC